MVTVNAPPVARRVWELFAELLDYPRQLPTELLSECLTLTGTVSADGEARLAKFQSFAEEATLGRLQEEYTRAFDMDESHSLYLGYHLLGESYKRSALLLEFMDRYRAQGMEVAGELADYLPVVLRFLAMNQDQKLTNEIVAEAIWPTLELIASRDKRSEDEAGEEDRPATAPVPYHDLVAALRLVVQVAKRDWQPLTITTAGNGADPVRRR